MSLQVKVGECEVYTSPHWNNLTAKAVPHQVYFHLLAQEKKSNPDLCVLLGAAGLQKTPTNVRKRYDGQVKPSLNFQLFLGVVKDVVYIFDTGSNLRNLVWLRPSNGGK